MNPEFLHRIYVLLFHSDVAIPTKQLTLEAAANCQHSWRVTHVSREALTLIHSQRSTKGLHRAHVLDRRARANHIFTRDAPMSESELHEFFWKHDTVTLVTKAENSRNGSDHWSSLTEVPSDIFTSGSFSLRLRKRDLAWAARGMATPTR